MGPAAELEIDAVNWERPNHLMIPMFWLVGQVMYNPATVESYVSRHIHMGPTGITSTRCPCISRSTLDR